MPRYKRKRLWAGSCSRRKILKKIFKNTLPPASKYGIVYVRRNTKKMRPKQTENPPLKKTEEELSQLVKERKIYFKPNRELIEELKKSLKRQPPGRVERL